MRTIWQDLRYSARLLRKHPGFTVTAVGVLTLGIGVNAGAFGIINSLMIRPLAWADAPGEVVGVFSKDRTAARDYRPFSYPGFSDVRDAGGPFAHLAGHTVALAGAHRVVLETLRSTPGIESVAEASVLPFGDYSFGEDVQRGGPRLKNEDPDAAGKLLRVQSYTVTSDYFKTLGLRMVQAVSSQRPKKRRWAVRRR
jgi:hypothetical protein